jgi:zinc protease
VNQAVQDYLQTNHMKVVMVTEDAASLKDALVSDEPSPVTYDVPMTDEILEEDKEIEKYHLEISKKSVRIVPAAQMFQD